MNKYLKIGIVVALASWALFVASERRMMITRTVEYTVQPGKQNFRPGESIFPRFAPKGFQVAVVFDSSAWYGPDEWEGDQDWSDWNKLYGLTNYLTPNNRQTAMLAWRPDERSYVIQVTAYTNDKAGGWKTGPVELVPVGKLFIGDVTWLSEIANYEYGETAVDHKLPRPRVARETGTWIGGANNAPGPYGGRAHKEMKILLETSVR